MFESMGQPSVKVVPDRLACARYGLNTGDVEGVVQAAIGGQAITQVFEGEKRFDLTVRWLEPYRSSLEAIREITVSTSDGRARPARRDRGDHARGRAVDHLSRGRAAVRAGEVQRPRARPRRHDRREPEDRSATTFTSRTTRTSSGRARSTS